ncbi:hypothetical protein FS837_008354 [Tulasnella sp. UAMH 9824]|nr:hypothetical protein FS837_008354 [Tulasnella sp. UAMH 9824]
MTLSKTYDFLDKTDSSPGNLPWPLATKLPGSWHGNLPFFRELQDEIQKFERFIALWRLRDQLGELFKCSEDCEYKADSLESEPDSSVHDESWDCSARNYCPPGMTELEDREFIILDQWIPRMSEAVGKLSGIRDKMIAR